MSTTVQVPPGIPDGATVGLYRLIEVDPDRRLLRAPHATPLDTATVTVAGTVTFSLALPDEDYAIHATANGQERWGIFTRGNPMRRSESERNGRQRERYHGGTHGGNSEAAQGW